VFSDKTGTLTQNSMDFRKAIIGGRQYGTGTTEAGVVRHVKLHGGDVTKALESFGNERRNELAVIRRHAHVEFNGEEKIRSSLSHALGPLSSLPPIDATTNDDIKHARQVRDFLYCMSLNNSVFPKVKVCTPSRHHFIPLFVVVCDSAARATLSRDIEAPDMIDWLIENI
jgi:magnesium-transporting ATPase (P-type)